MAGIKQSNETPIPVENGTDLLIALLYAPGKTADEGESITGATRLQKLFFLLREGEGPKKLVEQAQEMGFRPYKMGPFSPDLRDTVTELEAADILKTERLSYVIPDDRDASDDDLGDVPTQDVSSVRYGLTALVSESDARCGLVWTRTNSRTLLRSSDSLTNSAFGSY